MEIEIPSSGCFIASGYNVFDHYHDNQRDRYYLNENKLIRGSSTNYNILPSGYHCLSSGDLVYKPETDVYFSFMALIIVVFALYCIFSFIIKRLWGHLR